MSTQPEQAKAEILEQIVATIHEKVPEPFRLHWGRFIVVEVRKAAFWNVPVKASGL